MSEAVARRCSIEKIFLKISQNSQENTCAIVFFNKVTGKASYLFKKEALAQVFSCEIREIFKNNFFIERLR